MKAFQHKCTDPEYDGLPAIFMPFVEQTSYMGRSVKDRLSEISIYSESKETGILYLMDAPTDVACPDSKLQEFLMEIQYFTPQFLVGATNLVYGQGFEMTEADAAYFCKTIALWLNPDIKDRVSDTVRGAVKDRRLTNYMVEHDGKNLALFSGHLTPWILDEPTRKRKIEHFFRLMRTPIGLKIFDGPPVSGY